MDNVWLVEVSTGEYDSYSTWIKAVFDSEDKAVAFAQAEDEKNYSLPAEYKKLPLDYEDLYGNKINIAEVLMEGNGKEGDDLEYGVQFFKEEVDDDGTVIKKAYPKMDLLEKLGITEEQYKYYQKLYLNRERFYHATVIYKYEVNKAPCKHLIHPVYNGINNPCLHNPEYIQNSENF